MRRPLLSLLLILLAPVLWLSGLTAARQSQPDFADTKRSGIANVGFCSEQGPVTRNGFGYASHCDFEVTWPDGTKETVAVDRPGFADATELGHDITLGEITPGTYARPDRGPKPLYTATSWLLYGLAAASLAGAFIGLYRSRRRSGQG
ncbi:DUF6346 domain-containing protein [Actinoplanes couchii]|uniref:Uncharacterized protein n=1 Tax=Actinoplanes couchii TaxID=403638 RepID=A0ABQ3XQQ7_9ACTN|nr:DUF6346 domain-containing protein [Actinoplanes couchii]MDR6318819.1 hypothetical protein [Actinoplanes couchii]GID60850.1 hypothetical protein Aco03nite_092540 [Actinoplanes couchii]